MDSDGFRLPVVILQIIRQISHDLFGHHQLKNQQHRHHPISECAMAIRVLLTVTHHNRFNLHKPPNMVHPFTPLLVSFFSSMDGPGRTAIARTSTTAFLPSYIPPSTSLDRRHLALSQHRCFRISLRSMALKGKAKSKSGSKKKNKKKNTDNDSNESGVDVDSNDNDNDDISDDISDVTASFATDYHAPVMCVECIDALLGCDRQDQPFMFVDGTLGGGGHSSALLERLGPGDVVFGCDVDSDALRTASDRLQDYLGANIDTKPLFVPVRSNFCDLASVLPTVEHPVTNTPILGTDGRTGVDGILMDLGVSSFQIDTPERGFAFMKDGPLDMRMGNDIPLTAADVCNEFHIDDLQRILRTYGDEPRAKTIARSIVQHRPLSTTGQLVEAIAAVTPEYAKRKRMGRTASLARVFQSLRIVVNQEDAVWEKALEDMCPAVVRPGGRLVVLSYHSMEDRATKRIIRDGVLRGPVSNERDLYGNYIGTPRPWKSIGKARRATPEEVAINSRSRSATLRVAERQPTD